MLVVFLQVDLLDLSGICFNIPATTKHTDRIVHRSVVAYRSCFFPRPYDLNYNACYIGFSSIRPVTIPARLAYKLYERITIMHESPLTSVAAPFWDGYKTTETNTQIR